jgi:prevent-host-death family protein
MIVRAVGVRELRQRASAILRRVRDQGDAFEITYRGRAVARLVPLMQRGNDMPAPSWETWDELADAIARCWPRATSALEAVREQRRHL